MRTTGYAGNIRLHTCACGWFRELTTDKEADNVIQHPVYGRVTLRIAADMDIKHHDCVSTEISRRLLKGLIRYAA
jgi:hypothetical protein